MTKNIDQMRKYLTSRPKINGLKSAIAVHGLFSMDTQKCLCHDSVYHFWGGGVPTSIGKKLDFNYLAVKFL